MALIFSSLSLIETLSLPTPAKCLWSAMYMVNTFTMYIVKEYCFTYIERAKGGQPKKVAEHFGHSQRPFQLYTSFLMEIHHVASKPRYKTRAEQHIWCVLRVEHLK